MDSSRNTLTMDDSSNKIGGSPVPGGVPNGGEGPPDQMIEPLPAYGIQYFPYQQQAQQQQLGNNNAERRVPQNEPLEDPDTYQPLPINPPLVRNQQKIQPQQVFAFEEESQQEEDNGRASPFYFPDGPQLARKSLHQNMEEENFETPSRRDFLYTEEEERQNGQIYQQTQGGTTHSPESNMGVPTPPEQRTQETMIEPVLLHGQRPAHQQTEQQQQFQEEIDPQPWPPKPSPLPIPQPESQTWWNSNSAAETNDLRHEDGSFQPAASLPPSRGQQITEAREQGEQLELLQQRLPQVMLGKQFQTQQAGDNILQGASLNRPMYAPTILTEGTTPGIIWPGVTMQLHQISRPFENQLIFQQSHSQFTTGTGGLDFLGGIAESARLQATNRQLHPEQVQQHKANLSSATTAPQVTVDMVRKSRKNKQSETTVDNYVLRVHDMLEEAESQKFADIVSWQNHGRAFKIHSPEKFYEEILPKYFHCKQSSFVRWLRAWGFVRLIEGPDRGAYFHRYFVRGTTSLIKNKTRSQMHEAMDNWPRVGNITTSLEQGFRKSAPEGTKTRDAGNDANAAKYDKQNAGEDVVKPSKDPKVLRGKLLHEVRDMLRMAEIEGFSDIVSWCKSGQSFRIHKRGLFQKEIISKYLSCSKMTYLSDMLRMWGFCRLKQASGDEKNAYYHRLFQKGKPELCRNLSKEEMYEYMKDFREEQKRLQETSWSLIVADVDIGEESQRGGEDQRRNNTAADAGGSMDQSSTGKKHAVDTTCHGASSTSVRHQAPAASPSPHTMQNDPMPNEVQGLDTATGSIVGTVGNTAATANLNSEAYLSKTWIATSYTTNTYVNGIRNMLEDAEPKGFTDIVSWRPHGRCFKVHDEKHFEEAVLPKYFNAKLPSFYRWLRAWGFTRLLAGKDRGCWYHRYFVRGVTELVKDRSRKEMFDAMENWVEPGKEPDFHQSGKGSALSEKLLQKKMGKEIIPGKHTVGNENDCENEEPCVSETPQGDPKRLRGRVPEDIRDMLDQAKAERAEHVVSWLLHGKAFAIHNRPLFMESFMPRFFKSKKFCYFSDVIRSWGFVRLKESKDKGAYYHKLFRRDAPRATLHLSRKQMKDSMSDWLSPDGKEPNLYEGISEDIIRASEQMQSLRGRTKKKRARKKKDGATEPRKKARKTVSVEGEDVSVNGKILPVEAKTAEV